MASLNKVFLMGNLTREPELRFTPGGTAVCEFGIAINRRFSQPGGQEKEETCFLDIVVWGKQAESCSRFLQKGANVFIEGRLIFDQWEEKETRKKRSRIRVTAERVQFIGRRDDMSGGAPEGAAYEEDPSSYSAPRQAPQQRPYQSRPSQGGGYGGGQSYASAPQQGAYAPRQASQQRPPVQNDSVPQMPVEEDPFEQIEGVDDDIPF